MKVYLKPYADSDRTESITESQNEVKMKKCRAEDISLIDEQLILEAYEEVNIIRKKGNNLS